MEDDTRSRSLHTAIATALGILLIGAGCAGKTEPPQPQVPVAPQVQAPAPQEALPKPQAPFVACYRGEADLFASTATVNEPWVEGVRRQIQNGWMIDVWCREQDETGAPKYAFAFRKFQGLTQADLDTASNTYQTSGQKKGSPTLASEAEASQWSLVTLGYVSSERNRANEIPLLLSNVFAVNNSAQAVDSIAFERDLTDAVEAPRSVVAEMHGGNGKASFMVRFRYNPNSKISNTESYCRTSFESEDGRFSPDAFKLSCEPAQ